MGKILVTGATGFVGSRLVRLLTSQGQTVRVLVRPGSSLHALADIPKENLEVCHGDILIEHEVYRALAGCDRLYHVAAVYQMYSPRPEEILGPAIEGTTATLEAARKRGIERAVVTSSVAAIAVSDTPEPMNEDTPFNLEDSETYVVAKHKAEVIALSYVTKGLPVVVVNPCAVFGPGDWKPTPSGDSILKYLNWKWPIGFPCTEGGINAVDVDDVAVGHLLAMQKGRPGQRYILGGENVAFDAMFKLLAELTGRKGPGRKSSRGTAMLLGRFLEMVAKVSDFNPPVTYKLARDFVGKYQWVSSEKAERELGYRARRARDTLWRSVDWYIRNGYTAQHA